MMLAALVARRPKVCGGAWVGCHFRTSSLRPPTLPLPPHRLRLSIPMTFMASGEAGSQGGGAALGYPSNRPSLHLSALWGPQGRTGENPCGGPIP